MKKCKKRIAVLTAGGDCPGLNAVLRSITKKAVMEQDLEVIGIEDGYEGLVRNRYRRLDFDDVSGILNQGGTILGTSNKSNPFLYPSGKGTKATFTDVSAKVVKHFKALEATCLVCIGGDGTLTIANRLSQKGIPVIGVPKTIDNDIRGTDVSFGFDSAVHVCTNAIDNLHSTAQSHHRIMIVEVMGRTAGWIALHSGIAGGGDVILLPEIPYDMDAIASVVKARNRKGRRFSIIVVAEGAKPKGGQVVVQRHVQDGAIPFRLGGVGFVLADQIEQETELETRVVVLGHLQRSGPPTSFDRILGTRLGVEAVNMLVEEQFGFMVGVKGPRLCRTSLKTIAKGPRNVPRNHPLIAVAESVGTCMGRA